MNSLKANIHFLNFVDALHFLYFFTCYYKYGWKESSFLKFLIENRISKRKGIYDENALFLLVFFHYFLILLIFFFIYFFFIQNINFYYKNICSLICVEFALFF